MKLQKLVEIQHGTILSRVKDPLQLNENMMPMIAMQDLSYELGTNTEEPMQSHEYIDPDNIHKCLFGKTGNLILGLTVGKAMVLDNRFDNYLVPSNFALLKLNQNYIYPYYLMWFINESTEFKKQSELLTQGSIIKSLSIRELREITIDLPPLKKQKAIGEFYKLVLKRDKLSQMQKEYSLKLIKGITTIKEEE